MKKLAEETYGKLAPNARLERQAPAAGARPFRAGEGDARRPARRAHHRAALLSRAELRVGQARRGRGARPLDAHRRHGLGEQDLQAAGDRGQARRRMPAAGIPIQASIPAGSASTPSPPRTSPPRISTRRSPPWSRNCKQNGVTQDELDRARASYIAEFVYTSDSQSRMARHYGWRLATGMTRRRRRGVARPAEARDRRRHPRGRAQISCRQEFRHRLSAARSRIHQQHW